MTPLWARNASLARSQDVMTNRALPPSAVVGFVPVWVDGNSRSSTLHGSVKVLADCFRVIV